MNEEFKENLLNTSLMSDTLIVDDFLLYVVCRLFLIAETSFGSHSSRFERMLITSEKLKVDRKYFFSITECPHTINQNFFSILITCKQNNLI